MPSQEKLLTIGESSAAEIAAAFSKRQISFSYRAVELKFMVHDIREEVELKTNAALKEPNPKDAYTHHKSEPNPIQHNASSPML